MSSKRRIRRKQCDGKHRYSKEEAEEEAKLKRWPYHAYKCSFCKGWHIGRRPGRKAIVMIYGQAYYTR
jgi:hypothetical protein